MGPSNAGNTSPGLREELRAGHLSLGTTYLEREHEIVEVDELTKGRPQKEKIRGPGQRPGQSSCRNNTRN